MLWPFNHYPGTDYETFNWDWLLTIGKRMSVILDEWENVLKTKVESVLAEHPEWTTTVMDGAITDAKINSSSTMLYKSSYSPDNALVDGEYLETTYHYVSVPQNSDTLVYVGDAGDYETTPMEYAHEHNTTTTMITGITLHSGGNTIFPTIISDNTVLYSHTVTESLAPDENLVCYIGIPYDRSTINEYPIGSTPEDLLAGGDDIVVSAFFPLIKNGVLEDFSGESPTHVVNRRKPRCALGLLPNGTMIWLTSDGYYTNMEGLTGSELQTLMQNLGCRWAYAFDEGGSTSLVYKGVHVNHYIDGDGTTERHYRWTLNTKAREVNQVIAKAYNNTGTARDITIKELRPIINDHFDSWKLTYEPLNNIDLDDVTHFCGYVYNATNHPANEGDAGYLISIERTYQDGYIYQRYIPYNNAFQEYTRQCVNGSWSTWYTANKSLDITSEIFSFSNNWELTSGKVYRFNDIIWGSVVVHRTAGDLLDYTETVANLNYTPADGAINSGCYMSSDQWGTEGVGYLYVASSGISVKAPTTGYRYAKIDLMFRTN